MFSCIIKVSYTIKTQEYHTIMKTQEQLILQPDYEIRDSQKHEQINRHWRCKDE